MSSLVTKKLLEKHLLEITPSLATAFEGVTYTPVSGTPYQRVVALPRSTQNPTMGDEYYREIGVLQVFLYYPINTGSGAALARAELIRNKFKRGTTLIDGNVKVHIIYTPSVRGSAVVNDRLMVPVSIDYTAEILS